MRNFINSGVSLLITASGAAIASGKMVVIGARVAIASVDIADGSKGDAAIKGQFTYKKKSGDTFAQGALAYYDATNDYLTSTSSGNTLAGIAGLAAVSADTSMSVVINS